MWGQEANLAGMGETEVLLITANWYNSGEVAKNSTRNTECPVAPLQPGLRWPDQFRIYWHGSGNENLD